MTATPIRPVRIPAPSPAGTAPAGTATVAELAERWPDVARVPHRPVRAAVARRLMRSTVDRMPVRVQLPAGTPGGTWWGGGDAGSPVLRLRRPDDFFARLGDSGLIGLGEGYLAGDWDAGEAADGTPDDLVPVLTVFAERMGTLVPPALQRLRRVAVRTVPRGTRNTLEGSRSNIAHHYDLSNDLFRLFLDPTMTYSSALFDDGARPAFDDLAAAQRRKIDRLLDQCGVTEGSTVLEIGTGWGQLALQAAARGATVRSITLSEEQAALARARVAEAGLSDRVTIELCDYRSVEGTYDAVVSVEMVEAVGDAYWDTYFRVIEARLAPGGVAGVQAITMPHDRMLASRRTYTWIHKYVFPGGIIPSVEALTASASRASLRITGDAPFGLAYAETLRLWRERFEERAAAVGELGFDDVFRRMWTFYLAYSEAGFRARYLDVHQLTFRRSTAKEA